MSQSLNVLKQPKPFYLIFFLELWERFGYYGLQALLAVYLVREMGMPETESFVLFGAFSALVYGLVAVGGYLGDKVLGTKRTIVLGTVVLMIGYFTIAIAGSNKELVYLALGTVAVGNGLFKANPSSLLAKCYEEGDSRLDGAFTMYYMAINIGSFLSMLAIPYVADIYGWGVGYMACAVGLLAALLNWLFIRGWVDDYGSAADFSPVAPKKYALVLCGVLASCLLSAFVLKNLLIANVLLALIGGSVVAIFLREITLSEGTERNRMIVALVLMLQAVIFWTMYMQMPTSLNFFTINNVEHTVFGFEVNPLSFQSLNPFWIMVASPILAYLYNRSGVTGTAISMPFKFAGGMALTALSFMLIPIAANFATPQGVIAPGWIVAVYLSQSLGELLISGLGLSMVAQLVPARMHGLIMGAWFLTISAAAVLAGYIAGFTAVDAEGDLSAIETLPIYSNFFQTVGIVAALVALLMFITAPWLDRMLGKEKSEHSEPIIV